MTAPARPGIDYLPDNFTPPPPRPWPLWLRIAAFALLFAVLQGLWSLAQGTVLEQVLVGDWTVAPAACWIRLLTPELGVHAWGYSILAPGGGISVLHGCEGVEVLFLWAAAVLQAPLAPARRVLGLLLGAALVWLLNQVRIVLLFYAYRSNHAWFELLHGTLAPLVLVALVALAFALLLGTSTGTGAPAGNTGAETRNPPP